MVEQSHERGISLRAVTCAIMSSSKEVLKLQLQCTWDGVKGKHHSSLAWFLSSTFL